MKVLVNNHIYLMGRKEYRKLLDVTKKYVPFGIYAVQKDDFAEMKNDICKDKAELNKLIASYARQGFKVYYNG